MICHHSALHVNWTTPRPSGSVGEPADKQINLVIRPLPTRPREGHHFLTGLLASVQRTGTRLRLNCRANSAILFPANDITGGAACAWIPLSLRVNFDSGYLLQSRLVSWPGRAACHPIRSGSPDPVREWPFVILTRSVFGGGNSA